jgi:hypothetical protein
MAGMLETCHVRVDAEAGTGLFPPADAVKAL